MFNNRLSHISEINFYYYHHCFTKKTKILNRCHKLEDSKLSGYTKILSQQKIYPKTLHGFKNQTIYIFLKQREKDITSHIFQILPQPFYSRIEREFIYLQDILKLKTGKNRSDKLLNAFFIRRSNL